MKIIFMDFDGVVSLRRAWEAQPHISNNDLRWFDPAACARILQLCQRFDYHIVVTSAWRKYGIERISACFEPHGLLPFLHPDWRTQEIWPSGPLCVVQSRPSEITNWMARNPIEDFIILEDDPFLWTDEQKTRVITTEEKIGFTDNHLAIAVAMSQ